MKTSQFFFTRIDISSLNRFFKSISNRGGVNKLVLTLLLITSCNVVELFAQSQVFISEKWSGTGGITAMYHHNVSKTDDQQNVYVAGSTINSSGNHDIILQKFDRYGELLWQQTYNGLADLDDMAADLFIDDQYNVYVTGTITEYIQSGYDLCVLKYNSHGTLQWKYSYDNDASSLPYDAGTAITGDNDGSVFVTGGSLADTTMSDFITIRLNTSNGNEVWAKRYDYAALNDIAAKIAIKDGQVVVAGASQIATSPEEWELATLTYAISNGNLINENRTSGSATDGVDEIYDITVDDDYIYIAGAVKNSTTGYDIRIYKLDDELNIVWEEDFDGYEGADKAHGIKVDSYGNVYVAGYVTHPTQGRNYITIKYDSNGELKWNREYNGQANADDEAVQLVIDEQDRIFVTGKLQNTEYTDYVTVGYSSNGEPFGQAIFYSPSGLDDKPAAIAIDLDGDLIVTGQCEQSGGGMRTYTVKYKVYDKPIDPVIIDSVPSHNANELLIRFDRSVMNYAAVDNRAFTAGELSDFVKPQVIDSMNAKVPGVDFKKLEAYKVMLRMTTADSISISRLGDTLKVDDFWATISILMPNTGNLQNVADSLTTLTPLIHIAERNFIGQFFETPNDELYSSGQSAFFDPQHGINIEPAWGIQVGQPYIRIGVFDSQIAWAHEDFGDGTWAGSKVKGGYNYFLDMPINVFPFDPNVSHGTRVAGIIGAQRNNDIGIAGVAGGDAEDENGFNEGPELYSMAFSPNLIQDDNVLFSDAFLAVITGASYNPETNFGLNLDVQNHSWGSLQWSSLLNSAIHFCYLNQCTFVAASGNYSGDTPIFPASHYAPWVIKVGGSNGEGDWWEDAGYHNGLDFVAPATSDILTTTENGLTGYVSPEGTSFATAIVSGVAGLMRSEHNINNTEKDYPNNLAVDDIENLLKKYATDIEASGYDHQTGHGRINAGVTLEELSLPSHYILHTGGTAGSYSESITGNQVVVLSYNTNGVDPGVYNANLHQITQNFTVVLPVGHEVIDDWKRLSASIGKTSSLYIEQHPYFTYNISVDGNVVTVQTTTWCWWITTNASEGPVYKWIPTSPGNLKTAVSLQIQDINYTSVNDLESEFYLNIFPNPNNSGIFNLEVHLDEPTDIQIEVADITGTFVKFEEIASLPMGMYRRQLNLGNLSKGMYLCTIRSDAFVQTRRIVIQ